MSEHGDDVIVIGRLVEIHPGQAITVESTKTGEQTLLFTSDETKAELDGCEGSLLGLRVGDFRYLVLDELL